MKTFYIAIKQSFMNHKPILNTIKYYKSPASTKARETWL